MEAFIIISKILFVMASVPILALITKFAEGKIK